MYLWNASDFRLLNFPSLSNHWKYENMKNSRKKKKKEEEESGETRVITRMARQIRIRLEGRGGAAILIKSALRAVAPRRTLGAASRQSHQMSNRTLATLWCSLTKRVRRVREEGGCSPDRERFNHDTVGVAGVSQRNATPANAEAGASRRTLRPRFPSGTCCTLRSIAARACSTMGTRTTRHLGLEHTSRGMSFCTARPRGYGFSSFLRATTMLFEKFHAWIAFKSPLPSTKLSLLAIYLRSVTSSHWERWNGIDSTTRNFIDSIIFLICDISFESLATRVENFFKCNITIIIYYI